MAAPADAGAGPAPRDGFTEPEWPEDDADRRRVAKVGLGVAALSFPCAVLIGGMFSSTYAVARGLDEKAVEGDLAFALLFSLGSWIGFLALPALWASRRGGLVRNLGLTGRWVDIPLGVAVGLASTVVTTILSSLILTAGERNELEQKAQEIVDRAHGPVAVALLTLALCAGTPLAEEVFFRGLLFRSLHRLWSLVIAMPAAGLAFGLVHFSGGSAKVVLVQLGLLSLFGAALCAVVSRTGRLGPSIVAHATFNAVTVVTLLASR